MKTMPRRLNALHRKASPVLYYCYVQRHSDHFNGQYVCGYVLAYTQAGANVFDEVEMEIALQHARLLTAKPQPARWLQWVQLALALAATASHYLTLFAPS